MKGRLVSRHRNPEGKIRRSRAGRFRVNFAKLSSLAFALILLIGGPGQIAAYSVLSHEAIIDSAWATDIRPLLLKRFPDATHEQLKEAHGYAYGGAIIQDLGYYPHGNHFFSDLTHYVRSGDFVLALLRDSKDLNDLAFALGALAHYPADNDGHRVATNRSVPLLYPKLEKKYGDNVTYEQDPLAHINTEFGFDVLEVARGRYASDNYHDFIGFGIAVPLLEQAFQETYGLELKKVLTDEDRVFGSYRHDVSQLIPKATRVAWSLKKDEIQKDQLSMTREKFLFNLSRASYQKRWG
jgi:Zinc dependent phospholipase C